MEEDQEERRSGATKEEKRWRWEKDRKIGKDEKVKRVNGK